MTVAMDITCGACQHGCTIKIARVSMFQKVGQQKKGIKEFMGRAVKCVKIRTEDAEFKRYLTSGRTPITFDSTALELAYKQHWLKSRERRQWLKHGPAQRP